jgi:hypothetical protein
VQVAYTITEVSLALAIAFEDTSSKADDIHVAMNNIVSILRHIHRVIKKKGLRLSSWLILSKGAQCSSEEDRPRRAHTPLVLL